MDAMFRLSQSLTALVLLSSLASAAAVELRDGDRVVLVGGTLIEREQRYGYWEYAFSAAHPERRVSFRNLGWSADTVWAESRGIFDPPDKGYARLLEQVQELRPTLLILNYGSNEAWAGPAGLDRFIAQYRRLIDDLAGASRRAAEKDGGADPAAAARVVLIGPMPMEAGAGPNADPTEYNANVTAYSAAIARLAGELGLPFVDLLDLHSAVRGETGPEGPAPLTDNGLHLSEYGYWRTAEAVCERLCGRLPDSRWKLPSPQTTAAKSAPQKSREMLEAIRRKNELYFHRWRPQNVTYLFLFRKHEQGQNAAEIPQFDPLIEAEETRIAGLLRGGK